MSKFNIKNILLKNVQYNFENLTGRDIAISISDTIEIIEIDEKKVLLNVERELFVKPNTNTHIKIAYEVTLESEENVNKADVSEGLRERAINLVSVFSKISLLMSQITNMSPFGTIVTPPTYEPQNMKII